MNTAYDLMESLREQGAARFSETGLARDHSPLTRKVRRHRVVRTSGASVVGVAAATAVTFAAFDFLDKDSAVPPANPTSSAPAPTASGSVNAELRGTLYVARGERAEYVARDLAAIFDVSDEEATAALEAALPLESAGSLEGWVAPGEYPVREDDSLEAAAAQVVGAQVAALEGLGVPRSEWEQTVIIASILDKEAPVLVDKRMVSAVIHNRLEQGIRLEIESPLAYFLRADEQLVGDDGWAVDTPYNLYMYEGLPPTAVGAASAEALEAAANPAEGDWIYFLRKPDGNILVFSTFDEFAVAVDEYYPGTGASD